MIGEEIEPAEEKAFVLNEHRLSGSLFKPSQRLWAGGGRKRLSVFIVISRSWMGS